MTALLRVLAAAAALAVLAGCPSSTTPRPVLFNEPSALAVFNGITLKSGDIHPYLAVANAGTDDITLFDAVDDTQVLSPVLVHDLVYPVPGRPSFLVSASFGDAAADLLAVVTAGDLPSSGGSRIQVIRTWQNDGAVMGSVELGGDVVALRSFDPVGADTRVDPVGVVKLVAALADQRIALVTFHRAGDGIDPAAATTVVSAPLGFQPVDIAIVPGDPNHVYAATLDPLPGGVQGVAEIDVTAPVSGTAFPVRPLNAHAPTRLVAAASLAEADMLTNLSTGTQWDSSAFTTPAAPRVYAVLDESRCGFQWPIACGLVALDLGPRADLATDPVGVDTAFQAPFRAPIQIANVQALATSRPPVVAPTPAGQPPQPQYAGAYMAIATTQGAPDSTQGFRQTTGSAGVASADGLLTFIDLGRWDVPSDQPVRPAITSSLTVVPSRPGGTPGAQWIVLHGADGAIINHVDKLGLVAATGVTPGYTPSDTWSAVREGMLPNLQGLGAEPGYDGTTSIALQQSFLDPAASVSVSSVVRLYDPTLGVHVGDIVVLEPTGLSTCTPFEAKVSALMPPDATHPGGYVRLTPRDLAPTPQLPERTIAGWADCVNQIPTDRGSSAPTFIATFRAGDYVLIRGTGPAAMHVGRPLLDTQFSVQWQDEAALATTCLLPPAVQWDPLWGKGHPVPSCDDPSDCRRACEQLVNARLARRLFYLSEPSDGVTSPTTTGPALRFTLGLELNVATQPVYRDMALTFNTSDGKAPFRQGVSVGIALHPRAVVPWDRSPWDPTGLSGGRFIVPYAGGVLLDATPNLELRYGAITVQ